MDRCYQTDGYHRYVVLSGVECVPESYEIDMIQNNDIPYLLKPFLNSVDGEYKLYYEIDSAQEYKQDLHKCVEYWQILKLTEDIVSCLYEISEYMLHPDNLLIDMDSIFYDENMGVYRFLYVPGYGKNIRETLRGIIEELMKYLNHRDKRGTDCIYTLYEYISVEAFDMNKLLGFLDSCKIGYNPHSINNASSIENVSENIASGNLENKQDNISEGTLENKYVNMSVDTLKNIHGNTSDITFFSIANNKRKIKIFKIVLIASMIFSAATGAALAYFQYIKSGYIENVYPLMGILVLLLIEIYIFSGFEKNSKIKQSSKNSHDSGISHSVSDEYKNHNDTGNLYIRSEDMRMSLVHKNNCYEAFCFKGSYMIIGREKGCDYIVDSKSVSRVHARIYICNNMWVLEDMKSTNGTFVNNYPVTPGYPAVINKGDVIRFGDEEFILEQINPAPDEI